MKKQLYLFLLSVLLLPGVKAQSTIGNVLGSVAGNNKMLQAESQLNDARKLETRTGIFLPNPTVELNQLWADRSVGGNSNELAVTQSFDFPSVYTNLKKLSRMKSGNSDAQYAAARQQILLKAQQTCLEIIFLRKQKVMFGKRLQNAERLAELFRQRLENGDANQLDVNKIQLEKINAQNAMRLNEASLQAQLEQLQTLNGNLTIEFNDSNYDPDFLLPSYSTLEADYLAADPALRLLAGESSVAEREISLSRAQALPKFDLGYRRNGGSEESLNGFRVGVSIPLWENRNTVKKAKAQAEYAATNVEASTQELKTALAELYAKGSALRTSCDEYASALSVQNNEELLDKALDGGQISVIDYFTEINLLYNSIQNYLDVEKEYHSTLAQLFCYKL